MKTPVNTDQIHKTPVIKGRFEKGYSGNPSGKPKGALHKSTLATLNMLEGEAEAITRKAIDLALDGDMQAIKLCMDRIAPPLKPITQPIILDMPQPQSLTDTAKAFINASAQGLIPADIASQIISAIANVAKVEEMEHLKQRLESLERAIKKD